MQKTTPMLRQHRQLKAHFPHLAKLLSHGHKVAIAEQLRGCP